MLFYQICPKKSAFLDKNTISKILGGNYKWNQKKLAASTAICTAIGVTSVLTSVDAFASSITQESGNDTKGKLEIVTNPFKTFEDVEDFVDNTLESLLNNQAYRFTIG